MLDLVGEHPEGERTGAAEGLLRRLAIDEDTGQIDHLRDPTPVVLAIKFEPELHVGQASIARGVALRLWPVCGKAVGLGRNRRAGDRKGARSPSRMRFGQFAALAANWRKRMGIEPTPDDGAAAGLRF